MTTPAEHATTFTAVFAALVGDCERFALRPADVSIADHGDNQPSAMVYLPGADIAGVDALAGAYDLPADDRDSDRIYSRRGPVVLDGHTTTVAIYTARPDQPTTVEPALAAAERAPSTQAVAAIAPPVRVPSERAEATR
jgi:hypothetical protein